MNSLLLWDWQDQSVTIESTKIMPSNTKFQWSKTASPQDKAEMYNFKIPVLYSVNIFKADGKENSLQAKYN
jgi:hypothetical protein